MTALLRLLLLSSVTACALAPATLSAQQPAGGGRGAAGGLPLAPTRTVAFETNEGTWMSLDVSPDGATIIFDLLGDVYTLPIAGGTATRITSGPAMDAQPRFSPNGRQIVYVSDRGGGENLWIMDADGRNPRALTRGDYNHFVSPTFTPDGEYVVVSRNVSQNVAFTDVYELYLYHVDGGTGLRLINAPAAAAGGGGGRGGGGGSENFLGPAFGKDSRYVYFSRKANGWGYNLQFPGWQVAMYDRVTGRTSVRSAAFGSGMRPALSPDGKWLVYATRVDTTTILRVRDLASGDEATLLSGVQRDDQESRFTRDLLPGYAFTPDSRAIVLSHGGRFWRAEVPNGRQTPIPFTARVEQQLGPLVKVAMSVNDSSVLVRQIRDARPSPDGKQLVFSALDRLWIMDLPSGTPRRLTKSDDGEFQPAWSPDGKSIAYVAWNDKTGGNIYRVAANGTSTPEKLTRQTAFYQRVAYTPDATKLVTIRAPRQARLEEQRNLGEELVWLPATGGDVTTIASVNGAHDPHFVARQSDRVYLYDGGVLQSMRFDGTDVHEHLRVSGWTQQTSGTNAPPQQPTELLMAPDGKRAIATVTSNIYIVTVPQVGGATPTISVANPANATVPARRITRIGGDFINWSADGSTFHYSLGRSFFTMRTAVASAVARDSSATAADPTRVDVSITVPRDKPSGVVALVGARIVTMKGTEVIERGTVLVRGNRIAAVGPQNAVQIPAGATRIDVSGKTITPGFVDVHAHMAATAGVHRSRSWAYEMNLAYGVTTTRNPQSGSTDILTYADRVEIDDLVGPRILTTGPGIFSQENIRTLEDARDVLRRYSEFYGTHTIKAYELSPRTTRQYVMMAARELGLMPTTEGSLDLKMNLTELLDGFPGHEHAYPIYPLFKDVVQLTAQSGIAYTPTLLVQYGGPWNENYWYEHYDISADPKVKRFMPPYDVAQRAQRRPQWFREDQYVFRQYAEQAKKIFDAGGLVALGAHGQMQGLGVHWELWSMAAGGFTPHEALRIATINGADAIGLSKDLGSVEVGKLADLNVLDRNPLENIRNTVALKYVMKNGRVYDANDLSEVWPRKRAAEAHWWVMQPKLAGQP